MLDIEYRPLGCADAGRQLEQFADNIGMLRRVSTTIAGSATFDLVYARIGTQVIEGGERGRFGLSAVADAAKQVWHVTLRTDFGNSGGVQLRFPSSQEYDLSLRNANGVIVWTWSADKLFAQVAHDRTFNSNWSATVDVPMPRGSFSGAGFTIEAWLTSAEPKFATAVPVYLIQPAR